MLDSVRIKYLLRKLELEINVSTAVYLISQFLKHKTRIKTIFPKKCKISFCVGGEEGIEKLFYCLIFSLGSEYSDIGPNNSGWIFANFLI